MPEIKPNSEAYKNNKEAKEPNKTVVAKAKVKEKSFKQKVKEAIIAEDVGDLKEYAVLNVLIPAAKKTIRNLIMNTIDMRFFGKVLGGGGSEGNRGGKIVDYDRYSRLSRDDEYDDRPKNTHKDPSGMSLRIDELSNVQFSNEEEAVDVLRYLRGAIDDYGVVNIADFLEKADLRANNAHRKWGWYNLDSASVKYDGDTDNYYISFPRSKGI